MTVLSNVDDDAYDELFDDDEARSRMTLAAPLFRIYSIVIVISLISVGAAYFRPVTCHEWIYRFSGRSLASGARGFVIEAARSSLFLSLIALLLYYRFNTVTRRFLGLAKSTQSTWMFRLLFLTMGIAICGIDVARQIDRSRAATDLVQSVHREWNDTLNAKSTSLQPNEIRLIQDRIENISPCIDDCVLTYRSYVPYSLFNYLFAAIPIIVIWVFAMFLDLPNIHRRYNLEVTAIRELRHSANSDAPTKWLQIIESLFRFREYCVLKSARYIDVFAVFVLSYTFEHAIGSTTLTTEANELQLVTWIPLASVAIAPLTCAVFFGAMIERCRWFAISNGIELDADFDTKFGVATFWKTCLSVSMGGYIVFLCGIPFLKALFVTS